MTEITLMDGQKYEITWKDSFRWTRLVMAVIFLSWAYASIITLPLRVVYIHLNISPALVNSAAIGYALLNTIVAFKKWEYTRKALFNKKTMTKATILWSVLFVYLVVFVYSSVGWIIGEYLNLTLATTFWIPILIALWDSEIISREWWYLSVVGLSLIPIALLFKLLKTSVDVKTMAYGPASVTSLVLFLMRNHIH
ncbi:hypothetical protein [Thermococcus sp.]|uniref:hypothetical protein n=1 Tax=Thermococcus sp. TaxID=35749 RepID=UPI00262F2AE6|nr:hypothetical protein [Thermococcus sp.]